MIGGTTGTWGTDIQKAQNMLSVGFSNIKRGANDGLSKIKRNISEVSSFFKNGGTTVVGINVNKIPDMKKAISDYCKEVDDALKNLKNYDPKIAFKGTEIEPILVKYVEAVTEACQAVVSNLLAFNDQLDQVVAAWTAKDTANASEISKSVESARSQYGKYVSKGSETEGAAAGADSSK